MKIEELNKIVNKIRNIGKYHPDMKNCIATIPTVTLVADGDEWQICSIDFSNWDIVSVGKNSITLHPCNGTTKTLFEYNGWDELLKM